MVEQVGNIRAAAHELRVEHPLAQRAKVWAVCRSCRHATEIDVFALARYGRYQRLAEIEDRLQCRACRGRWCKLPIAWALSSAGMRMMKFQHNAFEFEVPDRWWFESAMPEFRRADRR
jgi:hypothetical protein